MFVQGKQSEREEIEGGGEATTVEKSEEVFRQKTVIL